MVVVRIDWDLKESFYGHLDIVEHLASEVTNQFVMVKASVDKEAALLSFYIVYNRKNEMCRVGKRNAIVLVENEM